MTLRPQTFKSSYIKLIVLLLDIIHTLISRFISISTLPNSEKAKASLAIFIIIGIVYIVTASIYSFRNIRKDCSRASAWLVDLVHVLGGVVYYVGDNYPPMIREYGPELGCNGAQCFESVAASESVLLGMAVVFYRLIPFCIAKYYKSRLAKPDKNTEVEVQLEPEWVLAAESLTLLVEFDTWFTVVGMPPLSFASNSTLCFSDPYTGAAWGFWVFFLAMYIFVTHFVLHVQYELKYLCKLSVSCVSTSISTVALWMALGLYLLSDNFLPLGCTGALKGNSYGDSVARIVMLIIVLIVVSAATVLLLVYRCLPRDTQEKLLPDPLYQHLHSSPDQDELPQLGKDSGDDTDADLKLAANA